MPRTPPLQPATREKTCQVCGATYVYPEKGSVASRFTCDLCSGLPPLQRKVLARMAKRVQTLERAVERLGSDGG